MNVRRIISHCAILFLSAAPLSAQITIDATYFHSHRDKVLNSSTYTMQMDHYPALDAIAEATGGGQTCDFSVFTHAPGVPNQLPVFSSAIGTPGDGDPDFGAANYVQFQDYAGGGEFWSYISLTDDGLRSHRLNLQD
ncbi:MAG TPA: hypothetical protein VMO47_10330 [Rhodothermales bacterium]|nr:hypothetical protein [Rhodothermales bacterium]